MKNKKCKNCDYSLNGEYCSNCGQRNIELLEFKKLVKDFLDHHLDLDSRLFITLKFLITKPGFLTSEYWKGRRSSYIPPFRIYLLTSLLYFFIYSLFPNSIIEDNEFNNLNAGIEKMEKDNSIDIVSAVEKFDFYIEKYEKEIELFLFLPFTALALLLLNMKSRHLYFSHHFIASIHLSSAFFILQTIIELFNAVFPNYTLYTDSLNITLLIYCALSIKNIYNDSLLRSFVKTILLVIMTVFMLFTPLLIFLIYSIL